MRAWLGKVPWKMLLAAGAGAAAGAAGVPQPVINAVKALVGW
jgi:hypothetical protein